jgi:hypothetical protein
MTRRMTVAILVATLATGAVITSGCGSSSNSSSSTATTAEAAKTANQILADAQAAAKSASSVHMILSGVPGQFTGASLDMSRGNGASGTFTAGKSSVAVVATGSVFYIKGDETFWQSVTSSPATAQLFAGKWIKVPSSGSSSLAQAQSITNMDSLFAATLHPTSGVTKAGTTTVNGVKVVKLNSGKGGSLYVSIQGTPYPVEIHQNPAEGGGVATFSGWNAPVTITVPSGALDFSSAK